jgi:hypothetical protein
LTAHTGNGWQIHHRPMWHSRNGGQVLDANLPRALAPAQATDRALVRAGHDGRGGLDRGLLATEAASGVASMPQSKFAAPQFRASGRPQNAAEHRRSLST